MSTNLHPIHDRLLDRSAKESLMGHRGLVVWMFGLSGSGKSTLAALLERQLHESGIHTAVLDGDNVRSGLNGNLGFSDADRLENIRRVSEVAKLFCRNGLVTLASFITPRIELRELARQTIGTGDFLGVYVKCDFETCARRDVKGLYAKAAAGGVAQFTGKDSTFEEPLEVDLMLDTDAESETESLARLEAAVRARLT